MYKYTISLQKIGGTKVSFIVFLSQVDIKEMVKKAWLRLYDFNMTQIHCGSKTTKIQERQMNQVDVVMEE